MDKDLQERMAILMDLSSTTFDARMVLRNDKLQELVKLVQEFVKENREDVG